MKRREMLLTTGATALGLAAFPWRWAAAADPAKKQHVLMYTRSAGFEHSVIRRKGDELAHAERIFTELGAQRGFDVTCSKDGRLFDSDLDQFDAFLFFTTGDQTKPSRDGGEPMSEQGKQRLLDAVAAGKGFVGSHCASDTFHSNGPARERQESPDPYIAMLGGEFISHGPQQEARQTLVAKEFPGVSDLPQPFALNEEWYSLKNFADNLHVILVQETEGMNGRDYQRPPFPATWARRHGDGRVFYTSMGHREDVWTNPRFQHLLLGGLSWTMGNVEADVTPNMVDVTPDAHTLES